MRDINTAFLTRANELTAEYMANNPLMQESSTLTTVLNQYFPNLVQRIGLTLIKDSGEFNNPLNFARVTTMPLGEYLQHIFVDFVDPEDFPQLEQGGTVDPFIIHKPFVAAYANTNKIPKNYSVTLHDATVKGAFHTGEISAFTTMLAQITTGIDKGREAFQFEQTKEILARYIVDVAADTDITQVVSAITDQESMIAFISKVKEISIDMQFWRTFYNQAGVKRAVSRAQLKLLIRASAMNTITNQLSTIFNQENLNFEVGEIVQIDNFGGIVPTIDGTIGTQLFPVYNAQGRHLRNDDGTYVWTETAGSTTPYTGAIVSLDTNEDIIAMLVEDDFLLIAEQTLELDFNRNARGKYTNFFLTDIAVYGYIPFSNAVVFKIAS